MDLDWTKVNITLVDDRFVDKSHNDSNEKLVNENLMINKAANLNFISLCNSPEKVLNIKFKLAALLIIRFSITSF